MISINKYYDKLLRFSLRKVGAAIDPVKLKYEKSASVLCPEETESVPSAIYLKKHLNRIISANQFNSIEFENERLFAKTVTHTATLIIPFHKSVITNAGTINNKLQFLENTSGILRHIESQHLSDALKIDIGPSDNYFGHWLYDEILSSLVEYEGLPRIASHNANYSHAEQYKNLLQPNVMYGFRGRVDNLRLLFDFSENSHRQSRFKKLRRKLEKQSFTSTKYDGVYIKRGQRGANDRNLNNEEELIHHLTKQNFDVVDLDEMGAEEVFKKLWDTQLVVSVEGSNLMHGVLPSAPNAGFLVLQPPRRVCHIYKGILDPKGKPYGFYVCEASNRGDDFLLDSFDDLDLLIDQIRNASAKKIALIN